MHPPPNPDGLAHPPQQLGYLVWLVLPTCATYVWFGRRYQTALPADQFALTRDPARGEGTRPPGLGANPLAARRSTSDGNTATKVRGRSDDRRGSSPAPLPPGRGTPSRPPSSSSSHRTLLDTGHPGGPYPRAPAPTSSPASSTSPVPAPLPPSLSLASLSAPESPPLTTTETNEPGGRFGFHAAHTLFLETLPPYFRYSRTLSIHHN